MRVKNISAMAQREQARRKAGRCPSCGRPPQPGRAYCGACREYAKAKTRIAPKEDQAMESEFGPLFAGVAARDAALAQVEANADEAWKQAALAAIHEAARRFPAFIVDEVWPLIPPCFETHEGRAIGALMVQAKKAGWIEPTPDFRASRVANHHATPRRIWRSCVFAHQEAM